MATTDQTTEEAVEASQEPVEELGSDPTLTIDLCLSEAEALRTWLLKPGADGSTSLEDPLVSRVLAKLGQTVDTAQATVNVRRELQQAGLPVDHLSDEQIRDLGRRVTEVAVRGIRP
ncbi:MAG TPA: hypothetical protein VHY83_12615 [Solirubrobacteraceae bacterium]|jgi:hypothetical protein|nr:hypothetical protein [Solirubrobacteraceae bacterium]